MATRHDLSKNKPAKPNVTRFREYSIPSKDSSPTGISVSQSGAVWFTETNTNKIGLLTKAGTVKEFPLSNNSAPWSIVEDSSGSAWFTESSGQANKIGKIAPSGQTREYPSAGFYPQGIALAPDGNVWFTESDGNTKGLVGKITPNGRVTTYDIPTVDSNPFDIALGKHGIFWFTENSGNKIGTISQSGVITEYALPSPSSGPYGIALGADGNMWFTESASEANSIGKITPTGNVTEYQVPTAKSDPEEIVAGRDGSMWFTESTGNKIGRINMSGAVSEFRLPSGKSFPAGITVDHAGRLWFAEGGANKIGSLEEEPTAKQIGSAIAPRLRRSPLQYRYKTTSDATFYADESSMCAQTIVIAKRYAATMSGGDNTIPDAPGVRALQSGTRVTVLKYKTLQCPNAYGAITVNEARIIITDETSSLNHRSGYVESADLRKI